jgi:hypothetical protein
VGFAVISQVAGKIPLWRYYTDFQSFCRGCGKRNYLAFESSVGFDSVMDEIAEPVEICPEMEKIYIMNLSELEVL